MLGPCLCPEQGLLSLPASPIPAWAHRSAQEAPRGCSPDAWEERKEIRHSEGAGCWAEALCPLEHPRVPPCQGGAEGAEPSGTRERVPSEEAGEEGGPGAVQRRGGGGRSLHAPQRPGRSPSARPFLWEGTLIPISLWTRGSGGLWEHNLGGGSALGQSGGSAWSQLHLSADPPTAAPACQVACR